MKNILYILFVLLTIGMANGQTCELSLDDLLTIDSQESFERVLIENKFQNLNSKEEIKRQIEEMSNKDTLLLAYGFDGWTKYSSSQSVIIAFGYFPKKSETNLDDNFDWFLAISNPKDEYSVYSMIFSEVKEKCTFDKVSHSDDGGSAAFYNCPNASFKGEIGFSIEDDSGYVILKLADTLKELDSKMGDYIDGIGKSTGDPNASGYYGNSGTGSGGNYRLGNRKAVTMSKPIYDCNEEGKVYVSISVDNSGKVVKATPGVKGTTNSAACLLQRAKEAALKTKFNTDTKAPTKQVGTIIYSFSLSN